MLIDGLLIDTNRDGIDLDCCRNVHVTNCHVNSPWDDAICPKASYALGHPAITENITIDNCIVSGSYKIGSVIDGTFQPFPPRPRARMAGSSWAPNPMVVSATSPWPIACSTHAGDCA
jgi:hypothetical protein